VATAVVVGGSVAVPWRVGIVVGVGVALGEGGEVAVGIGIVVAATEVIIRAADSAGGVNVAGGGVDRIRFAQPVPRRRNKSTTRRAQYLEIMRIFRIVIIETSPKAAQ
jgi:hypothetical protein